MVDAERFENLRQTNAWAGAAHSSTGINYQKTSTIPSQLDALTLPEALVNAIGTHKATYRDVKGESQFVNVNATPELSHDSVGANFRGEGKGITG